MYVFVHTRICLGYGVYVHTHVPAVYVCVFLHSFADGFLHVLHVCVLFMSLLPDPSAVLTWVVGLRPCATWSL
jgi:hypothetical protein